MDRVTKLMVEKGICSEILDIGPIDSLIEQLYVLRKALGPSEKNDLINLPQTHKVPNLT